jgi:sugar lactone lactonase YvrE
VPTPFRCPTCGQVHAPEDGRSLCPACHGAGTAAPPDAWWVDPKAEAKAPAPPPAAFVREPAKSAPPVPPPQIEAPPQPLPELAAAPEDCCPLARVVKSPRVVAGACAAAALIVAACFLTARALPRASKAPPPEPVAWTEPADESEVLPMPAEEAKETPSRPAASTSPAFSFWHGDFSPAPTPQHALQTKPLPAAKPAEVGPPEPAAPRKVVVKRRRDLSEDDLRRQIEKVPEVALDRNGGRLDTLNAVALARAARAQGRHAEIPPTLMKSRPDLAGLPMRMGDECHLSAEAAEHLQGGSLALRQHLLASVQGGGSTRGLPGDTRPDPRYLHRALNGDGDKFNKWLKPEAVPALQQLLMAENEFVREVLVDQLARIEGKKAGVALAQRALFDLSPSIRRQAIEALARRPAAEYRQVLLAGFNYPWPAVSDHAAEALVALEMRDTVTELLGLLDRPDPDEPYQKPGKEGVFHKFVREVVRVNHLRNCAMCHAVSLDTNDKVRGRMPRPDQTLPPAFSREYYASNEGTFVRADVTYLQQDFSLPMTVRKPGPWPSSQRFDFLVRERPATPIEETRKASEMRSASEYKRAVFFALRELTGQDPGPAVEDWKRLFLGRDRVKARHTGLKEGRGVAADARGTVYLSDNGVGLILRAEAGGVPEPFLGEVAGCAGLALDGKGRLLACDRAGKRLVAVDLESKQLHVLADKYQGRPLHGPLHVAADAKGGVYFTDAAPSSLSAGGKAAAYYLSSQGTLTRLAVDLTYPTGVAVAPDGKTLYLVGAGSLDVWAYPLESAGAPLKGHVLCKLGAPNTPTATPAGGAGLAVDGAGNLYVANPATSAVQVINPAGARLGVVPLPAAPRFLAVAGKDRPTLYVTTRTTLYEVELRPAAPVRTALAR